MIKIVNFCGGRGSNSMMVELLNYPHVRLINIINAYDDGKSTGEIRKYFRMLGPSDIRKNQIAMMYENYKESLKFKHFINFRFPNGTTNDEAKNALLSIIHFKKDIFSLSEVMSVIDNRRRKRIQIYLNSFIENLNLYEKVKGEQFRFSDCSLANCIYAGAFEMHGRDFGLTVDQVGKLFNMRGETITNSNENRHLIAIRENGLIMNSESEIVESRTNIRIREIYIVERPLTDQEKENLNIMKMSDKIQYLQKFSSIPNANSRCIDAIKEADIIIYSPGTQHSSLYPTYMTKNIGQIIRENHTALKVFIANIGEDYEIPAYSVSELVRGALIHLKSSDPQDHPNTKYIDFVIANNMYGESENLEKYIKCDPEKVEKLGVKCIAGDYEDPKNRGKHEGALMVKTIISLLNKYE